MAMMNNLCALFAMPPFVVSAIFHETSEIGASAIDAMAIILILSAFAWASIRFLMNIGRQASSPYERYKLLSGKLLSLGLEFLVAADVIHTVTATPTSTNIGILGAIILTRTF
jgi:uncharacterized membrane protein